MNQAVIRERVLPSPLRREDSDKGTEVRRRKAFRCEPGMKELTYLTIPLTIGIGVSLLCFKHILVCAKIEESNSDVAAKSPVTCT